MQLKWRVSGDRRRTCVRALEGLEQSKTLKALSVIWTWQIWLSESTIFSQTKNQYANAKHRPF